MSKESVYFCTPKSLEGDIAHICGVDHIRHHCVNLRTEVSLTHLRWRAKSLSKNSLFKRNVTPSSALPLFHSHHLSSLRSIGAQRIIVCIYLIKEVVKSAESSSKVRQAARGRIEDKDALRGLSQTAAPPEIARASIKPWPKWWTSVRQGQWQGTAVPECDVIRIRVDRTPVL